MAVQSFRLPAGQVATVTAVSAALLYRVEPLAAAVAIAAAASASVGPFASARTYAIDSDVPAAVAFTTPDPFSDSDSVTGAVFASPTITGTAVLTGATLTDGTFDSPTLVTPALGTPASGVMTNVTGTAAGLTAGLAQSVDGGTAAGVTALSLANNVTFTSTAGAPADAVKATLSRNPAGDDNALTYTAVAYGVGGNSITITYADPAANNAALSVAVVSNAITVNLATGAAGAITSTAAQVKTAIEASTPAAALVAVAIDTTDTGVADNGSGIVTALASAAMTGGAGTGIGTAGIGSLNSDRTNGKLYINGGTLAVPVWKIVTSA